MTRIKTDYKISKYLEVERTSTHNSVVFFVSFYWAVCAEEVL